MWRSSQRLWICRENTKRIGLRFVGHRNGNVHIGRAAVDKINRTRGHYSRSAELHRNFIRVNVCGGRSRTEDPNSYIVNTNTLTQTHEQVESIFQAILEQIC